MSSPTATGIRGILAPARLDRWLQVALVAIVVACAVRYLDRHGMGLHGALVLVGAALLALAYSTRTWVSGRAWWPTVWAAVMVLAWGGLTWLAPSFAWCAVPLLFAVLQVFPFPIAAAVVVAMTVEVSVAWLRISTTFDPTLVVGPVGVAVVTVLAFRALDRESAARQELIDELTQAQESLASEQRRSGALAERTRLSREIHDSVGQGLSSINLLLQAATQSWEADPSASRRHVQTAAATARDGLVEVRRVVQDLAPGELASGDALEAALREVADQAGSLPVAVRIDGERVALPPEIAVALVRTARGALANVAEHAAASRAALTLTYHEDEVLLDVRDDGCGFVADERPSGLRGHGIRGIVSRAEELCGSADIESAPGEGTTVTVRFPVEVP